MADPRVQVDQVIAALHGLGRFPVTEFMRRVYNKVLRVPECAAFRETLKLQEAFGVDQDSARINNMDESDLLSELAVHSVLKATGSLDAATDKPTFGACVNKVCLPARCSVDGNPY